MDFYYSTNKNVQFLVALLKKHGIKRVIASPGTTNLELMVSLQHDDYFEMYSCIDERSAAYMACGLATETNEPVVITCTEATASRDYYPGMTEAYHRKLPILAVTGLHDYNYVNHLEPQVIDRSVSPNDSMRLKVNLPVLKCERDEWDSILKINNAILELTRNGGGPVHMNIPWGGGKMDFSVQHLPDVKAIHRYFSYSEKPTLVGEKIAVFVGSHYKWRQEEIEAIDNFCYAYNAIVICDHTSKYYGKYRVQATMMTSQSIESEVLKNIDVLIHIGEEFADDITKKFIERTVKNVWRVSPDGELRDTFKKLENVFEMTEYEFFKYYAACGKANSDTFIKKCIAENKQLHEHLPELPFSSIYIASRISAELPTESVIHFGLSDSIRAWNYFDLPKSVTSSCNAGCRGIDGCVSSLIGASLAKRDILFFGVYGDLTFFYDMNVLGNRNIGNNVRILIINNDGGNIFRHNGHPSQMWLGYERANLYICAGGHYGKQSKTLVKNYAENLGFEYLTAASREEFDKNYKIFVSPELRKKSIVFEVFTECVNDSNAFDEITKINQDMKGQAKDMIKGILGDRGISMVKKIIKK